MRLSSQQVYLPSEKATKHKSQIIEPELTLDPPKGSIIPMSMSGSYSQILSQTNLQENNLQTNSMKHMFFEKQNTFSSLCLTHSINNLFGEKVLTQADMQNFCTILSQSSLEMHRHKFIKGDYDANVLHFAMEQKGKKCIWYDKRKKFMFRSKEEEELLQGYIVNIKKEEKFYHKMLGLSARHFIALKWVNGAYYVIYDSQKEKPDIICDRDMAIKTVNQWLQQGGELFEIYK